MDSNEPRKKRKQDLNANEGFYSNDCDIIISGRTEKKMQRIVEINNSWKRPMHCSSARHPQSQGHHSEQERERRREISVLYELLRQCISSNDVYTYLPGREKPIEKLSQLDILEISTFIVPDELHDMKVSKYLMEDIKRLEALCRRLELQFDVLRPTRSYLHCHKDIADMIAAILSEDKE